jgi:hypothetical protein
VAKLKLDEIVASDINEYAEKSSDFAFEQRVFCELITQGFDAEHGGTYVDPVTGKPREFDIRAKKDLSGDSYHRSLWPRLFLAVECKNIGKHFPLVIGTVPRRSSDAFHEVIVIKKSNYVGGSKPVIKRVPRKLYDENTPVGKDCVQVGRLHSGDDLTGSDQGIYEKWSQAISSSHDLVRSACAIKDLERDISFDLVTLVLPIVVVPDNTLWVVNYDGNGGRVGSPVAVDQASYFVGHRIPIENANCAEISHLHFCTLGGLKPFFESFTSFPTDKLIPSSVLRSL